MSIKKEKQLEVRYYVQIAGARKNVLPCPGFEKVPQRNEHRLHLQPRQGVLLAARVLLEYLLKLLGDETENVGTRKP